MPLLGLWATGAALFGFAVVARPSAPWGASMGIVGGDAGGGGDFSAGGGDFGGGDFGGGGGGDGGGGG
jgi:hypothetical protein